MEHAGVSPVRRRESPGGRILESALSMFNKSASHSSCKCSLKLGLPAYATYSLVRSERLLLYSFVAGSPLWQTSRDFGGAGAEDKVAVGVVGRDGGGASIAITIGRQMDLSFNLRSRGEATVGIEAEVLQGRIERPHARALPRPEVGSLQGR